MPSHNRFKGFVLTGRVSALVIICLLLIIIASPVVSQGDDAAEEIADVVVDKRLSLQIDAPKEALAWGDEVVVRLTAANIGADAVEAVALNLHNQPGVAWGEGFKGQWLDLGDMAGGESRVIEGRVRVEGLPGTGSLTLLATLYGQNAEAAEAAAVLSVPQRAPEEIAVSRGGSLVDAADSRVQFNFPEAWNESDAQLTFHLQEQFRQEKEESGRLLLFTVEATANDSLVEAFDKPVEVVVNLSDLVDLEWSAENRPIVSTRKSEKEPWSAVESSFDPKTGTLTFLAPHFSSFQVMTDPQLWKLNYNPPGASPFTGAATYQYPIDLPPGVGGLTPSLALSYSSRSVDSMKAPVMSQGFGAGWSLPQAQITNGNSGPMYNTNGCCNFDRNAFTLILNGVTYNLSPASGVTRYGRYYAAGQPDIHVEYLADNNGSNDTNNVSGEFWRVRTGNGTIYTFGRSMESEQVVYPVSNSHNLGQLRNKLFSPYNWKLDLIQDVHDNKVEYVYGYTTCGLDFYNNVRQGQLGPEHNHAQQCTEVDTAVSEIRYNFVGSTAQTTVVFTYEGMNGGAIRTVEMMNVGAYRPTRIDIKQKSGATTTTLYSYLFTYHALGFHFFTPYDVSTQFWMLAGINKLGLGGSGALPTQTFNYEMIPFDGCATGDSQGQSNYCVKALKQVNNGYGAVTEFTYVKLNNKWMHVTAADAWDGVAAKYGPNTRPQSRLAYSRAAADTPCYDSTSSACHLGSAPPSDALVGFKGVTILTQAPNGASAWTTLGKQVIEFRIDNYWLLGRTALDERFTSGGVKLSRSHYQWIQPQAGEAYVVLDWEAHATYDPLSESRFVAKTIDYIYYPYNPGNDQYGAMKEKRELDDAGNVRCTQYEYAQNTAGVNWLINYPLRETLYNGTCTGSLVSETLYRYAGSANPTQKALDSKGLLTYVLRRTSASAASYATEKRTYTAKGLPQDVITYSSLSSGTQYATDQRNVVSYEYTDLGLPKKVKTVPTGIFEQVQTISYDASHYWLPVSVADPNNIVTKYGYDSFGRLSKVVMPNDAIENPTISYEYFDDKAPYFLAPLVVGIEYKGNAKSAERQFYDGLGRLVQTQVAEAEVDGANKDIVASTSYNAQGLAICATVPYPVAPYNGYPNSSPFKAHACTGKTHTATTYDALGRPTQVTTPDGAATKTVYGVTTHVTVDGKNNFQTTQITDGNNHRVINYSNANGQLVLVREHTGGGQYGAYADARYSYDVMGNLTAVRRSAPNNSQPTSFLWQTSMGYDALGRKTTMSDPDMRDWSYVYDNAGNLARQEHRSGTTVYHATCFYYDNLNRVLYRANDSTPANPCPAGAPTTGADHLASYTYGAYVPNFNNGRLTKVAWGPNPTQNNDEFNYDNEGRLFKQTRKVNDQTFVYEVTAYDVLDRPTSVKLPGGEVVTTTYDQEGVDSLKTKVPPATDTTTLVSKVGYNERGQMTLLKRANGAPDTTLGYHGAGENFRLNTIVTGGTAPLPDFTYSGYDNIGNLTHFGISGDSYTYTYNELNRLIKVEGVIGRDYTYDLLGNFVQVKKGSQTWNYTYASGNHSRLMGVTALGLVVDGSAGYDTWGNMRKYTLEGKAYELTFNAENRLASLKAGTGQPTVFAYDADGQRVMTTYPDGTIVYTPFPDYELTDPPGSGANTARTTYRLGGQIVAVQTKVNSTVTIYYTYTDHLGNVTALSTLGGGSVSNSDARYDPFGTMPTAPATNPDITNHGFTGHRHNNTGTYDLKLIYMNARYYMPQIGRFISPDTIVPNPANPQSFNRYLYVRNNPMNFTDPTGHMESSGCDITDCTNGGTVNPNTYRSADGTFSFVNPTLSARYPSTLARQVTRADSADAFGVGVTFNFSLDTPIAGIELMAGREAIHVRESRSTTNFIIVGGGVRVGPSTSFINSLKGMMKGGSPINATVSPYVSAVQNVDDAAADYSGDFVYNSTMAAYQVGITIAESYVPGPVGETVSSTSIGPAFGIALTTSTGTAYSIPTTTQQPGQLIPTFHNPLSHLRDLASWIWSGITGD